MRRRNIFSPSFHAKTFEYLARHPESDKAALLHLRAMHDYSQHTMRRYANSVHWSEGLLAHGPP